MLSAEKESAGWQGRRRQDNRPLAEQCQGSQSPKPVLGSAEAGDEEPVAGAKALHGQAGLSCPPWGGSELANRVLRGVL